MTALMTAIAVLTLRPRTLDWVLDQQHIDLVFFFKTADLPLTQGIDLLFDWTYLTINHPMPGEQ